MLLADAGREGNSRLVVRLAQKVTARLAAQTTFADGPRVGSATRQRWTGFLLCSQQSQGERAKLRATPQGE
ncbi:MAG: hypothetical protein JNM52_09220 [Betaproteobacteria bacterium]|nr:hypothetical protein [Betaproteobacteria bacterium]